MKYDLETTLITFLTLEGNSNFTIRNAVEGIAIFGGIGSGKTSGSGALIASKYVEADFGGLVLTAKESERQLWENYCLEAGRSDDLIIVEPGGKHTFNFLNYEASIKLNGGTHADNLVNVLKTVLRSSEEKSGGKTDDPFWESSLDLLLTHAVDLCLLAYNSISIQQLFNIVLTAPNRETSTTKEIKTDTFIYALKKAQENVNKQVNTFLSSLDEKERAMLKNEDLLDRTLITKIPDAAILKSVDLFFVEHYRNLAEKTRSIIELSFLGFLFKLLREPIHSLLCNELSTFSPEDCFNGKIILIDLPVKLYQKAGRDAQVLFKYCWQRAMERRKTADDSRPVFLFADEAQHFLHEYDAEYQATARESRIATVYISQNTSNYHANMGGQKSEFKVKGFLATLGTKIFHANSDETNRYASEMIGEAYFKDYQHSHSAASEISFSESVSYKLEKIIRPEQFTTLKTGGPLNNYLCEAIIHRQGVLFPDGRNHRKITFQQNIPNS